MSELSFSMLDSNNDKDVINYEKAFFHAFYGSNDPTLEIVWDIDKTNKRIKTKIAYTKQDIFVARLNSSVVAAVAINYVRNEQLQLEMLGFSIDKSPVGFCEGLVIFNNIVVYNINPLARLLRDFVLKEFKKKSIQTIYGTSSPKMLKGYRRLGWEVIDKINFGPHVEYLIKYCI